MRITSLSRRLTALALCLGLLSGVGITAGAAWDSMDYDIAYAYAQALEGLPEDGSARLLTVKEGDLPLMLTTWTTGPYGGDVEENFRIWTWNGQRAAPYDFAGDLERDYAFGYELGTYEGRPALRVGDDVSMDMGGASGSVYYAIENGKLTLLHRTMHYTAYTYDGVTAEGSDLPLVQGTSNGWGESAPVSALVQAGWLYLPGAGLLLDKVDGQYLFFDSQAAQNAWWEEEYSRFTPYSYTEQFIEVTTGGAELTGHWSTVKELKGSLYDYAVQLAAKQGAFLDVAKGHYACEPVKWAVENGITNGTSQTTFSPNNTCTQGQILTFLYRAMGEPSVSGSAGPEYYANALLWAKEEGIVTDPALAPNAPCKRSDVVLYLWRLAGEPGAEGAAFSDVSPAAPYAQAVAWAVETGITNGTSETTFSPDSTCTRGQIVTFLYRDLGD